MPEKAERLPRKHLIYAVKVYDMEGKSFAGRMVDISEKGMKIMTKEPIFIGDDYRFEIALPHEIEGQKLIKCSGRNVWYERSRNPEHYTGGFEIAGEGDTDKYLLKAIMIEFSSSHL